MKIYTNKTRYSLTETAGEIFVKRVLCSQCDKKRPQCRFNGHCGFFTTVFLFYSLLLFSEPLCADKRSEFRRLPFPSVFRSVSGALRGGSAAADTAASLPYTPFRRRSAPAHACPGTGKQDCSSCTNGKRRCSFCGGDGHV